jgi:hypothetical protein
MPGRHVTEVTGRKRQARHNLQAILVIRVFLVADLKGFHVALMLA